MTRVIGRDRRDRANAAFERRQRHGLAAHVAAHDSAGRSTTGGTTTIVARCRIALHAVDALGQPGRDRQSRAVRGQEEHREIAGGKAPARPESRSGSARPGRPAP